MIISYCRMLPLRAVLPLYQYATVTASFTQDADDEGPDIAPDII